MQTETKEQLRIKIREIEAKFYHYSKASKDEIKRLTDENKALKRSERSYGNHLRESCLKEAS